VETLLALIGGIAVFCLMLLAVVNVTGRHFFNSPLPGYVDWINQAMPIIAFMAIAYCQRLGGHIRMDILVGRLKGRTLWLAEMVSTFVMLLLMLLLIWGSFSHFLRSFDFAAPYWSRDSSIDIALPIWPAKLLAPVAFSVLAARLMIQIWGYARAFITGSEVPVAIPLIEDAATIAAKEAQSVSGFEAERLR
jgi:TRAP-type C4-dicarboxylate transport system permease small subunit